MRYTLWLVMNGAYHLPYIHFFCFSRSDEVFFGRMWMKIRSEFDAITASVRPRSLAASDPNFDAVFLLGSAGIDDMRDAVTHTGKMGSSSL